MKAETVNSDSVLGAEPSGPATLPIVNAAPFDSDIRTGNRGMARFTGGLVLPGIAALCLYGATLGWRVPLTDQYLVLGLLAFALLYPGRWATSPAGIRLGDQVLTPWLITLGVLLTAGLVLGLIDRFDWRVLAAWAVLTPFVQAAALYRLPAAVGKLVGLWRDKHRVVVVGANHAGQSFARALNQHRIAHSRVVAYFDDRNAARLGPLVDAPLAGTMNDLRDYVQRERVDQVYVALPLSSHARITSLMDNLRDCTASIYFVPDVMSLDLIQPRLDTHAGFPIVSICESPFHGVDGAIKRGLDLLLAGIAVIALSPLMLVIAAAIKLTSEGPALFKQKRYGMDGSEILVWKFRSMTVTEDGDKEYKQVVRGDSRLTAIGAFLRKTSLDELPQFINVLQGRMSIVGPRPHALMVNEHYRQLIPGYMVRHKVRPGITGWAQVNGYRGGDDLPSMTKRVEYDLDYLRHWSVWMDLKIIARTAGVVFKDTAAY